MMYDIFEKLHKMGLRDPPDMSGEIKEGFEMLTKINKQVEELCLDLLENGEYGDLVILSLVANATSLIDLIAEESPETAETLRECLVGIISGGDSSW